MISIFGYLLIIFVALYVHGYPNVDRKDENQTLTASVKQFRNFE
jgi:hypothetical protein